MSAIGIVVTKLKATAAVTALVAKGSIYPIKWPQAALPPAIIVNKVGGTDPQMLTGAGKYFDARVRIECLATGESEVVAISAAVIDALGDVVKQTIAGFSDVDIIYLTDFTDTSDDRSMARSVIDVGVRYRLAA